VAEPFPKWGTQVHVRKFLRFELATVASQALKYDVITYTPYEGLNQCSSIFFVTVHPRYFDELMHPIYLNT